MWACIFDAGPLGLAFQNSVLDADTQSKYCF